MQDWHISLQSITPVRGCCTISAQPAVQVERSRRQIGDRRPYFEVGMSRDFEKTQPIVSGSLHLH